MDGKGGGQAPGPATANGRVAAPGKVRRVVSGSVRVRESREGRRFSLLTERWLWWRLVLSDGMTGDGRED